MEKTTCRTCAEGRRRGMEGVWCMLMGIMISAGHEGCKYHQRREDEHETGGSGG